MKVPILEFSILLQAIDKLPQQLSHTSPTTIETYRNSDRTISASLHGIGSRKGELGGLRPLILRVP